MHTEVQKEISTDGTLVLYLIPKIDIAISEKNGCCSFNLAANDSSRNGVKHRGLSSVTSQ